MGGAFTTAATVALFAGLAWRPPRPRRSTPFNLQFAVSWWLNELPAVGFWWLVAGTAGTLLRPPAGARWWALAVLVAVDVAILARLLARAVTDRAALARAFGSAGAPRFSRPPWLRIVAVPIVAWRPDVRKIRDVRYGPAPRGNRLDVYLARRRPRTDAPVLIYLHSGGFVMGSKALAAHHLCYRLAAAGWVCVSANYRLAGVHYADRLADVQRSVDWVMAHAPRLGGDPRTTFLAGGSAGAHLAATAALSRTDIAGVIGLYGYYGSVGGPHPNSPGDVVRADAPPVLLVHGWHDPLVRREDARAFAERVRAVSKNPVLYAQLPGAGHNFDFFPSARCQAVADAVARFAELCGAGPGQSRPAAFRAR